MAVSKDLTDLKITTDITDSLEAPVIDRTNKLTTDTHPSPPLPENEYDDYVTVMLVKAKKVKKAGNEEYSVILNSGKTVTINKKAFESQYVKIGNMYSIQDNDITNIVHKFILKPLDDKSIIGVAILKTGFRIYATVSSLVSHTDKTKGKQLCKEKLLSKIRAFYSFIVQWAKHGLRYQSKYPELSDSDDISFVDLTDIDE